MQENELLPESLHFLQIGWWILHAIAITLVLSLGYWLGARRNQRSSGDTGPVGIPRVYRFLEPGWWIIHAAMIPLIFYLGHLLWPGPGGNMH